ncbi:NAD dependent epimerase/dehydratase family/Saccharopine dehydrogenase NADP binding domain/NAD(P)H-binding, putative [Angomonas deanei]|uniref:NAD dependent epimerase/dehydratase family/Saccharopine dehydrogenase NADP binding domain/NAD(P)H-binding, putative n=1 Tax=Angomonas deanei TaxID=59799 RepID=A0A7G2CM56_9TRYP|nr:NAD dependent epimerase/dehydratase family/Saccharopine dehydrogenase NADP binding domain/NAD(P)H-binding, putative [Angomonas deanei]
MSRKFDIIVLGATGYTGKLVCEMLKKQTIKTGAWAIAGRSQDKLTKMSQALGLSVPTFTFDVEKPETLDAVCSQATVVISCAGPFNLVGMPVVDSCVRCGTHYVDSTGEFTFVRKVIEKHHDEAVKKNIVMVSCCGFGCVPSDVGNYILHKEAKQRGEEVKSVCCYYDMKVAGASDGTVHSVGSTFDAMTRKDMDPCSLNGSDASIRPYSAPSRKGMWYHWAMGTFSAPLAPAGSNERVVRRTNYLMKSRASYVEAMVGGFFPMLKNTIGLYLLGAILMIAPVRRWLLNKFFPLGPQNGPSEELKKNSRVCATFVGETDKKNVLTTTLVENRDTYDATAVYLVACAVSASDLAKSNKIVPGVLTPCSAFGEKLVTLCLKNGMEVSTTINTEDKKTK